MSQKGFLCPQCHQDMPNMEMLQTHLQEVHMKQSPTISKGFFSFAKLKIKSVQDNKKTSNEPPKIYAQYFAFNLNDHHSKQQHMGYARSYNDYFKCLRKDKIGHIYEITKRVLLRAELLTNIGEHIPRHGTTKERLKYEQNIVTWMEDSIASVCTSCSKSFGLFGRKHHCRLDGLVICNQCSRFLSFSIARWLIELNTPSSSVIDKSTLQRLIDMKSITSSIIVNDGLNDDYLRICLPCGQFLERCYDKIRFRNIPSEEVFQHYQKIVDIQLECDHIRPIYSTIIDCLLNGDTKYPIIDAQRLYQQLNTNYDKIDSTSRLISKLPDSFPENDNRYIALCRSVRTYSIQIVQNYSASTKRVPSKDDIKRANEGRNSIPEKIEPFVQQSYRVIHFIQQDKLTGRDDEVIFSEGNISK